MRHSFTAVVLALLCAAALPGAHAQSRIESTNASDATAMNAGNHQGVTINQGSTPAVVSSTSSSDGSLRTTGQAIAPVVTNSSGTYTCFGGASAAVGFMGGALGGGSTVAQAECYRLHAMDKVAARVNAGDKSFIPVWDALMCQFPDVADAYRLAGKSCPQAEEKARQAAATNDPYIAARLAR